MSSEPYPPPRQLPQRTRAATPGQSVLLQLVWCLFILWIAVCVLFNFGALSESKTVTQELSACAKTAVALLVGYMLCRAVEGIARP